ncbi:hypothetical protein ANCCEY_04625 [Ancylostoma ceylanicum]|uniref:Uncharacterized protein n=1 Tax=Ancylostoma ceylanicum TaxID=53326 RepID=A0A0D6LYK7_9BILA|nr:hypothetical protein ANCCEY_04625 [Ancylostoma ceylanicum]
MWTKTTKAKSVTSVSTEYAPDAARPASTQSFPFSENLVKLEQMSIQSVTKEQELLLQRSNIPPVFWPYVNITAVEQRERKRNATDGGVITDEDVADVPDDDDHPQPNTMHNDGKKTTITISEEGGRKLYQHWTDQAVSGLMATVATDKLKKVGHAEKMAHKQCNKGAKTVKEHAICVVMLLEAEKKYQRWLKKFGEKNKRRLNQVGRKDPSFRLNDSDQPLISRQRAHAQAIVNEHFPDEHGWVGSFRMRAKRSVTHPKMMKVKPVTRSGYDLIEEPSESPLGMIAKNLLRDLRKLKNKKDEDFKHWKQLIAEIREEGNKIKRREKAKRMVDKRMKLFLRTLQKEGVDRNTVKRMNLFGDEDNDVQTEELMKKAYQQEHKETEQDKLLKAPIELVRHAVKISMMMSGKNVSNFDKKNFKMISPRFLPVVPEEDNDDDIKLWSPSLFALHNDGSGIEKETSLARAMKIFGEKDNAALLNFIMEASGVSDALDNMKMAQMNSTGYIVMNKKQRELIYGPSSPYHDPQTYKSLSNVSASDVPVMLEKAVRGIATETMKFQVDRRKDITLSPLIFTPVILDPATASQPIVLSPLLFDPLILSPAVFGVVVLSPYAFVPIILGPRVLSPVILSPNIWSPLILSPMALSPIILNPGVGNPLILSPLALCPFILSPVALNPLILSPFVLNPFIGIPHTLSPIVLSPFVLSPVIYSPPYYSAFFMSPHALSPSIESHGQHFISILSPSWLS